MVEIGLKFFIDRIETYRGKKSALIANHTSLHNWAYSWDLLRKSGITLKKIFSPEHGLFSTEQDQVGVGAEPKMPCEVISLYGSTIESLKPQYADLTDVDILIYDIQDIGSRYYTYLNTMIFCMQAAAETGTGFVVLDRPNPINGRQVEGPILCTGFESFVGIAPVSVRHGMTAGEMALFARDHFQLDLNLKIIKMQGWQRHMFYDDTGVPWVPPSPNMPKLETATLYPGLCLVEGTNISEGRGTTFPFEIIGAPYIKPEQLAEALNSLYLPGITFRPHYYKPQFHKYAGSVIGGVYLHVTGRELLLPFKTGVAVIKTVHDLYPDFKFLRDVYEFNSQHPAFDLLTGSATIREMIHGRASLDEIAGSWEHDERDSVGTRKGYLLY